MGDVDTKELETLDPIHYSPVDVNGGLFGPPFPVVHDQLLCPPHIEGEVVVLAPHCQVVGDQDYHRCVVRDRERERERERERVREI